MSNFSSPTSSQTLAAIKESASALASQQAALATASAIASGITPSPPSYKIIGIILALTSGLFIGSSFVFKKKGLLVSQQKVLEKGGEAGESHAYLKSPMWWSGMSLMILGEVCNFVAYAFADAILVTPMGALSVVISAILSSIFLKETLSFFGKIGCFLCILGATIIAVNGPQDQAVSTISEFEKLFIAPGFLVFASIIIVTTLGLIFVAAPKWGKTNMLVYISICSLIGGLSVVATQGLGASIVTSIRGDNQFKHWFMYFLIGFVICTLLTEINYLNKALELFNTAMVTPTYYVMFTFSTLVASIILFQGLKAPVADIITLVLGFLVICCGITLLQMSKVDPMEFTGLDQKSTVFLAADKEVHAESGLEAEEPGVDCLRGFGGVIGSIHRNSLIARQSTASSLASMSQRGSTRRRRQDSYVRNLQQRNPEIGMVGMQRHSLWDRPASNELLEDASKRTSSQAPNSDPARRPSVTGSQGSIQHETSNRKNLQFAQQALNNTSTTLPTIYSEKLQDSKLTVARSRDSVSKAESATQQTSQINRMMGSANFNEHGAVSGEPIGHKSASSPMITSSSRPVRVRTVDTPGSTSGRPSSTATTGGSEVNINERPAQKARERLGLGGHKKKKSEYDTTELQSLVRSGSPSLSSSSCSSDHLTENLDQSERTREIDESDDQIRIISHLPIISSPSAHQFDVLGSHSSDLDHPPHRQP